MATLGVFLLFKKRLKKKEKTKTQNIILQKNSNRFPLEQSYSYFILRFLLFIIKHFIKEKKSIKRTEED